MRGVMVTPTAKTLYISVYNNIHINTQEGGGGESLVLPNMVKTGRPSS